MAAQHDAPGSLLHRQAALSATLDKFRTRAWDWKTGHTCVHLARFHLRQMGHKPEAVPAIRSEISARRALATRGWQSVADMLDAQPGLARIAPAMMLPGDLAVAGSADGMGAVFICLGGHKLMGWREDVEGMVVLDVMFDYLDAAWRA